MSAKVDLRCSSNPGNLLARMRLDGTKPAYVQPDNLIELSCRKCTSEAKREDPRVIRVLHLFDFAGEFVRTEVKAARSADTTGEDRTRKVQHG